MFNMKRFLHLMLAVVMLLSCIQIPYAYAADEPYFRRQLSGSRVGYGGFGRTMTGVISNADLVANKAGLRMYKDLQSGCFKSMGDYVSKDLCEEANWNGYTTEMETIVRRNGRK